MPLPPPPSSSQQPLATVANSQKAALKQPSAGNSTNRQKSSIGTESECVECRCCALSTFWQFQAKNVALFVLTLIKLKKYENSFRFGGSRWAR